MNLNFQKCRGKRPGWPQGEAFPWRGCFHQFTKNFRKWVTR
nr:MAG TPA: hypothetical protein [Caudoviricetes sp.]